MEDVNDHDDDKNASCDNYKDPSGKVQFFDGLETLAVDQVLDTRETKNCRQYLVSFKSWIAEDYLQDYRNLLQNFWNQRVIKENEKINFDSESCAGDEHQDKTEHKECDEEEDQENEDVSGSTDDLVVDEYDSGSHLENGTMGNTEESYEMDSEELLPPFHPTENGTDRYDAYENDHGTTTAADKDHCCDPTENGTDRYDAYENDHGTTTAADKDHCCDPTENGTDRYDAYENDHGTTTTADNDHCCVPNENDHRENGDDQEDDKENDDANNITNSTSSDISLEVNILKESNPSCKKRKLKTLDDIVRKITKSSNDSVKDAHYNNEEDLLSDRLFTLDQTLIGDIKKEELVEAVDNNKEKKYKEEQPTVETNGLADSNVYWSGGKAYQKNPAELNGVSGEKRNSEEKSPEKSGAVKSRQRYQKCRFCSTLYSDPALLERHENSHFVYKNRHGGVPFHEGIPPPPLVPVVENRRAFPQYQQQHNHEVSSPNRHYPPPPSDHLHQQQQQQQHQSEDNSIVRKPIRHLLSKLYETETRDKYEQQAWMSPEHLKRSPSPRAQQTSPTTAANNTNNRLEEKTRETTCPACQRRFDNMDNFLKHFESHHPELSKFVCNVCEEVFLKQEHFEAHARTHVEHVCRFCHMSFDQKDDYETHLLTHSQAKAFRCHICGRSFSLRTNLRRHLLVHSDATPYFCHACGIGFRRPETLTAHMKEHQLASNGQTTVDPHTAAAKHRVESGDPPHGYHPIYERRHSDGHHGGLLHTSPRQMEHSPSRSSNASHDSNEHQHYEPVKMVAQPPSAPRYYKEQNPTSYPYDAPYPSPNNNPQTKYKPSPKSPHMVYRDGTEVSMFYRPAVRGHPTDVYEPTTTVAHHHHHHKLQQRKARTYSPIKPNPMKIVPAPIQAQQHHMTTGGGAFECLKCGEKFTSPSLYDIHVQSHKEVFECEKCHKSFAVRSQYDVHMQSHDNSKSHKCPYCHRSFSMKGNLRRHIRIHTNEAPYECPICFQRFRRSDGLKGHIKRHETLGESAPTDLLPSQAS